MVIITPPTSPSGTFGAFRPKNPQKKSSLPAATITLAVILILGAVYYFFFYQGVSFSLVAPVLRGAPTLTVTEVRIIQLPRFSFDVFDSSFYKSLQSYGALPVVADSLGRTNPFIPY